MTSTRTAPPPRAAAGSRQSPGGRPSAGRAFLGRYARTLAGLLAGLGLLLLAWHLSSAVPWSAAHPWPAAAAATAGWICGAAIWLRRQGWSSAAAHAVAWIAPAVLLAAPAGSGWLPASGLVLWAPMTTVLAAALTMAARPMETVPRSA